MTTDLGIIRADYSALREALEQAGARFKSKAVVWCPFHDDKHPSGSVYHKDGVWRFKCHVCDINADVFDVQARHRGAKVEEVIREFAAGQKPKHRPPPKQTYTMEQLVAKFGAVGEKVFPYTNPETMIPDMVVIRIERDGGKRFLQCRPVAGGFVMEAPEKPWPIYNRIRVASAEVVVVVEGEKVVHALHKAGIVATTSPGGAGKAQYADWSLLEGKTVYLWPDNDEPGISHMADVVEILGRFDRRPDMRMIDVSGLPAKADAADVSAEDVRAMMESAQSVDGLAGLEKLILDTIEGRRRSISWPWKGLDKLTKALLPGKATILCGTPNSGKTFFLLQALKHWRKLGLKVAYYVLEDTADEHLLRVYAQAAGCSDLLNDEWLREHREEAMRALTENRRLLSDLRSCVHEMPEAQLSLSELADWVELQAKAGVEIIAIDPITAGKAGARRWEDDENFIMRAKAAINNTRSRLILVTHPRLGGKPTLEGMAGGQAYPRFAHTVLWLVSHNPAMSSRVKNPPVETVAELNRELRLAKTRNGPGEGLRLGMDFEKDSLHFIYKGVIVKD